MILIPVDKIDDNSDKKFFIEKIEIFIKLINICCLKYKIGTSTTSDTWFNGAYNLGMIENEAQIERFHKILGDKLFDDFKLAVSTYQSNKVLLEPYLKQYATRDVSLKNERNLNNKHISVVDLFCGAGGLSLGFSQAGYSVIFASDFEQMCIETYAFNHPEISQSRIYKGDIRKIASHIEQYVKEEVDILVGGPPCQGFSSANKHHRVIDDPRNELYKYFIMAIKRLRPKVVVMENVKGMLKVANQVVEDYHNICVSVGDDSCGYSISYKLLNSADFSVAQNRERLIYIAIRDDVCKDKGIRPEDIFHAIEVANRSKPRFNLSDALQYIKPLKAPHKMNVGEVDTEENGRKIDNNEYLGNENEYLKTINRNRLIPFVFNHKARYCSELNQEIYSRMEQGDDSTDPKIADIMPYTRRNDKFKDKYFRLYADRPCRTITAHLRSDCHSHIHPFQDRTLTPREAARVQSFPDDYLFLGPYLKTYIQIGNAVPPLMANGIADVLKILFL